MAGRSKRSRDWYDANYYAKSEYREMRPEQHYWRDKRKRVVQ